MDAKHIKSIEFTADTMTITYSAPLPGDKKAKAKILDNARSAKQRITSFKESSGCLEEILSFAESVKDETPDYEKFTRQVDEVIINRVIVPLAKHGNTFKDNKRGRAIVRVAVEEELKEIILSLGERAFINTIIKEIDRVAKDGHSIFQEVDFDNERIFIKNPVNGKETERTFKNIQNIVGKLKKTL